MLIVPVYIPSYEQSGETYRVSIGSRVSWQLAVADGYLPEGLLATINGTAEPAAPAHAASNCHPTLLRQGGLTAWWDPGRPVSGHVELRAWFWLNDTRIDPNDYPSTVGEVVRLQWALSLLRQRSGGPWERVPGWGLGEVESTEIDSVQSVSPHFPQPGVDVNDGSWQHIGWIAQLRVADDAAQTATQ